MRNAMKAIVTEGHGAPDVLVFRDIDAPPAPKGREVLVRVRACGVCRRDILVRQGPGHRGLADPLVLGHEISGEVMVLGPDARGLKIGERVCPRSANSFVAAARCAAPTVRRFVRI